MASAFYFDHMSHWSSINHAYLDKAWKRTRRFDFYRHEVAGVRPSAEPALQLS